MAIRLKNIDMTDSGNKKNNNKSDTSAYWSSQNNKNSTSSSKSGNSSNKSDTSAYWSSQNKNSSNGSNKGTSNTYKQQQSAAQTAAEAARKAKIEAYEIMRKGIKDANAELSTAGADLLSVVELLNNAFSGEKAKTFINTIKTRIEEINEIGEKLNNIDKNATQKEIELGGTPNASNSETYKSLKPFQNPNDAGIYRCDIEAIRDVASVMDSVNERLYKAKETADKLPKDLEGCEKINDVPSQINSAKEDISGTSKGLKKEADAAENVEKKNKGIIDGLTNFVTGVVDIFKGKEEKKPTYVNMEQFPSLGDINKPKNDKSPVIKKENDPFKERQEREEAEHYLEILAKQNDVDIKGKSTEEILEETTIVLIAKENGINTKGKSKEDIIYEIANSKDIETSIETTKTEKGEFGDVPLFNQLDYFYVNFGSGNIRSGGCGPTSLCMLWSAATGELHDPEELMTKHPEYGKYYVPGKGCSDSLMQNEEALAEMNLKLEGNYYWGEAWGEGKLMEALKNGCTAIWRTDNKNFTNTGHYLVITGITEDGKLIVNDPNGANYMSNNPVLVEGFANGFDPDKFSGFGGNFYVYSVNEDKTVTKTIPKDEQEILNDVLKSEEGSQVSDLMGKFKEDLGGKGNNNIKPKVDQDTEGTIVKDVILGEEADTGTDLETPLSNAEAEPDDAEATKLSNEPSDKSGNVRLTPKMGLNKNGPSGTETWYPDRPGGAVKMMERDYGFKDLEMTIREDGVRILSGTMPNGEKFKDLVVVAADVKHMTNPDGTFERGDIVETSLGTGIIVDYCERAVNERKYDGNVHFDIATAWGIPEYRAKGNNPVEEITPTAQVPKIEEKPENSGNIKATNLSNDQNDKGANVTDAQNTANEMEEEKVKLTARMGLNKNGPSGSETWYPTRPGGAVKMMENDYGFTDLVMTTREDGVRVLSGKRPNGETFENLVVVAADVKHMTNPDGTFERGDIIETSLGKGIVVDYCQRSVDERKRDGHIHIDIATTWE